MEGYQTMNKALIKLVFAILFYVGCSTNTTLVPKHEAIEVDSVHVDMPEPMLCESIVEPDICMERDDCEIKFSCEGKQLCDLIKVKENCEFMYCNWTGNKCLPKNGTGECSEDSCSIPSGCFLQARCVRALPKVY